MDIKFLNNLTRTDSFEHLQGDITFDYNQDLVTVSGIDYIKQQYAKLFISGQGNDAYFSNFGTTLPFLIFTDVTSSIIQSEMVNTILGAVAYQLQIETSNLRSERVTGINDIQIEQISTTKNLGATVTISLTAETGEETTVLIGG